MKHLEVIKMGVGWVTSIGVGVIINNAVSATTPKNINVIKKVLVAAGGLVLSSMVSDAAVKYTENKIDEFAATLDSVTTVEGFIKKFISKSTIKNSD